MSDLMTDLSQHGFVAALTALAIIASVIVAGLSLRVMRKSHKRTHDTAAVNILLPLMKDFRENAGFVDIEQINDALASGRGCLLNDALLKSSAARTLTKLCCMARIVDDPDAWHSVLRGAEPKELREFLKRCSTLVWIVRTTPMVLQGDDCFYDEDDKGNAAREIYRAMRTDLYGIQPPQQAASVVFRVRRRRKGEAEKRSLAAR
jgi:hypothetical protein